MSTLSIFRIRKALFASVLTLTFVSKALHAQWVAPRSRVTVPFAFEVGSSHFAAGTYILSNSAGPLLSVQGANGSALVMSSHEISGTPAKTGKVIFHRYGNKYFLREILKDGETDYVTCAESDAEASARREMQPIDRSSVATPINVEVALLQSPR